MYKKLAVPILVLLLVTLIATPSFANHRGRVLGESTQAAELDFPGVSSGPGAILPNSPFFVFDTVWQKVKLFTARSAEDKAIVRAQIAGERLAELRIMLSQNDPDGIAIALSQIQKEAQQASTELSQSAANGQNVEEAAKELNEAIKLQREILGKLANQTTGSLRLQLKTTREELKASKVEVEDELPDELLENEIEDELKDEIEEDLEEVDDLSDEIEDNQNELDELNEDDGDIEKDEDSESSNSGSSEKEDSSSKSGSGSSNSGSGSGSSGSGSGGGRDD